MWLQDGSKCIYEHTSIICHGDVVTNCCQKGRVPEMKSGLELQFELCRPVGRVSIMGWWCSALCEEAWGAFYKLDCALSSMVFVTKDSNATVLLFSGHFSHCWSCNLRWLLNWHRMVLHVSCKVFCRGVTEIRAQGWHNLSDSDPQVWTLHPLFRSQKDLTPTYRRKVLVIPKW
jgi:hypothetical protein